MNERELILEVIQQTLEAINEQDAVIRLYKGQIPQIELDIIMDNIRKLYENYYRLNKLINDISFLREKKIQKEETPPHQEAPEEPVAVLPAKESGQNHLPTHEMIEIGFAAKEEKVLPEVETFQPQVSDIPYEEVPQPETNQEIENEPPQKELTLDLFLEQSQTVAEKFKPSQQAVGDILSHDKKDHSIAARMQQSPITDLKSFIGINDRFIFMNELFSGNMKSYDEAIHKLNIFTTLDEAMTYLRWLKDQFGMNDKLDSFKRLNEFIFRKYMK